MNVTAPSVDLTVVVPTYNRLPLLQNAVQSLRHQSYPRDRYEILIVSDGFVPTARMRRFVERDASLSPGSCDSPNVASGSRRREISELEKREVASSSFSMTT